MMIGPMKKKVITSSVVTAIVLILIFGVVSYLFISQNNKQIAELKQKGEVVQRYVFTKDLVAGDVISLNDISLVDVKGESAPEDSFEDDRKFDMVGRRLKVNAQEKTIVTESLFYDLDDDPELDTRLQEYNMLTLPSDLVEGDYIDVRIRFATGEDYSVIVGKKIESVGALNEQSNTIFLRLSEEEIVRMSSAIIESYINNGVLLYANKYVDPSNQLYDYKYVDLVSKYKDVKYDVTATNSIFEEDENSTSGETRNSQRERTVPEIASLLHISERDVENIIEAIEKNDNEMLKIYSNKLVKTEKSIQTTYPVKIEVANLIKNNPNILEIVKAKYNVDALIAQRKDFMNTDITKVDAYTGEVTQDEEHISNITEKLDKEIETQKSERQQYLLNLLSKQTSTQTTNN